MTTLAPTADSVSWPAKHNVFDVLVSATEYADAEEAIIRAARQRRSAVVTHLPVAGVVAAVLDEQLRRGINTFDIVAPDGQPVRWALNRFHKSHLRDRCYGPELMLRLCRRAAAEGIGVYLYGSTEDVVTRLQTTLQDRCPGLRIVGCEAPPFRPLTSDEDETMVQRINASGAGIIFLGLGCPKQDLFAYAHRDRLAGVQVCVGAAFDFHAGNKKMAPRWMQRTGLEWLFRLSQEPKRLSGRYFKTNSMFIYLFLRRWLRGR